MAWLGWSDAPPPGNEPDVLRRYLATGEDPGTVRLGQGALLRIVRDGRVEHEYLVLAGSGFVRLPGARVLRGGDGKGFAIVVPNPGPAGSRLPAGRYRLSAEYRRDNRAVDPGSPVFTSAGHQYPEQVSIDIPW